MTKKEGKSLIQFMLDFPLHTMLTTVWQTYRANETPNLRRQKHEQHSSMNKCVKAQFSVSSRYSPSHSLKQLISCFRPTVEANETFTTKIQGSCQLTYRSGPFAQLWEKRLLLQHQSSQ